MKYISTRGGMDPATFSDITLAGLAPDGGLTVPEHYPQYSMEDLLRLRELNYQDLAIDIFSQFSDIPIEDLRGIVENTYTKEKFRTEKITPVREIFHGVYLEDLSNGSSLAFKDIALQLLGNLFEYIIDKNNDYMNILGSSSGDTVSAALEAIRGKKNMNIFMITPYGRMSSFQAAQAYSILDPNVFNIALMNGVFDDCQDMSKAVSMGEFKKKYHIGAVNSYNLARVIAQIVYYFKGHSIVTSSPTEEVDFAVPTGNLGNILAGYYAKQMGLPIRKLILATNENSVLDEFFKFGYYKVRETKNVVETSSPSQDISKASNFERFLFDIFNRDPKITEWYMKQVENKKFINLQNTPYLGSVQESRFVSGSATHEDRLRIAKEVKRQSGEEIDPHTANGVKVGLDYKEDGVPLICLGTAKLTKFEQFAKEAFGYVPERPPEFEDLEQRDQRFKRIEKGDIDSVKKYIEEHAITR